MSDAGTAICTITTAAYRAQVACMLESYLRHHPGSRGFVLHVDEPNDLEPGLRLDDIVHLRLADLGIAGLPAMRARYSLFELCNALKPFLLRHLFETADCDRLCYGDGDLFFFGSVHADVWHALETDVVLLTPHLVDVPAESSTLAWRDLSILQHGTYNGGFIALRRDASVERFLGWWSDRTERLGQKRLEDGLNCDQRWLDLLPGFNVRVHVSRHPGLNAAYWNLHERRFTQAGEEFLVNGHPLLFYHFSGYSLGQPDRLTSHYTAFDFDRRPDVRPIFTAYRRALLSSTPVVPPRPASASGPAVASLPQAKTVAVSVIIPAHNAGRHLAAAIESTLAQRECALEVVIVDDGSTDDTAAIARQFMMTDGERVRLISQQQGGVSAARNRGIESARGRYVAFLDADDWHISPTRLADQAAMLDARSEVGIVHSGWCVVDAVGAPRAERRPWLQVPQLDLTGWLLWQPALPSAMMVRRNAALAVGGFDVRLRHLEDLDFALRLTLAGWATDWLKSVTVAYRQHDQNATFHLAETEADMQAVLDRFFATPQLPSAIRRLAHHARSGALRWLAHRYAHAGSFADMARILRAVVLLRNEVASGTVLWSWLDDLGRLAQERGEPAISVHALTSRPEWQALMRTSFVGVRLPPATELLPRTQPATGHAAQTSTGLSPSPAVGLVAARPKLDLSQALAGDYGHHRSGWSYALRSLASLHQDGGIWVDAFPEHTFDQVNPAYRRSHTRPWIGFLHNPPNMPEWFIYTQSPQRLLANHAFQESLRLCRGLFCLSETLAQWWRERVDIPVAMVRLPTAESPAMFSIDRFVSNPRRSVVQIGSWLRKLHSIYYLPVRRLSRTLVHQHRPYIADLFSAERQAYRLQPDETLVTTSPFLDDAAYDDMLAGSLAYLELYDSSANNVVVECLARATPVLVNPLPAVVEYLGADYPFYFTNRNQAARKAEDIEAVEAAHRYLARHPLRQVLSGSAFAQAVADSSIYQALDA